MTSFDEELRERLEFRELEFIPDSPNVAARLYLGHTKQKVTDVPIEVAADVSPSQVVVFPEKITPMAVALGELNTFSEAAYA